MLNGRYLVQQRLKEPYYGYHGFITGKIKWGEKLYATATRELKEEAGLTAETLILKGIEHKMDYTPEGALLEDKYFYIVKATNLSGELQEDFNAGKNFWQTTEEIKALPDLFGDMLKLLDAVDQDRLIFFQTDDIIEKY